MRHGSYQISQSRYHIEPIAQSVDKNFHILLQVIPGQPHQNQKHLYSFYLIVTPSFDTFFTNTF